MTQTEIQAAEIANDFIATMRWARETPEEVRSAVIGNIRGFWQWMHSDQMEGCQSAVDQAMDARFHQEAIVREIPVWVCADEFTEDKSTGVPWGPEHVWAIRRDDGTQFVLTPEEEQHWAEIAAKNTDRFYEYQ